ASVTSALPVIASPRSKIGWEPALARPATVRDSPAAPRICSNSLRLKHAPALATAWSGYEVSMVNQPPSWVQGHTILTGSVGSICTLYSHIQGRPKTEKYGFSPGEFRGRYGRIVVST